MIKAFTQDIKRIIEVIPVQDVSGEPIYAKLYLDGCYQGIANTVRPDEDSAQVIITADNTTGTPVDTTLTIYGKYRFQSAFNQLEQTTVTINPGSNIKKTVAFNPEDYDEFKTSLGTPINLNSIEILKRQYQTVDGIVIGGKAKEAIAVPCDFRRFEPDEDYSIVFVAEQTGVIARDILSLFANDGYSFDGCQNT